MHNINRLKAEGFIIRTITKLIAAATIVTTLGTQAQAFTLPIITSVIPAVAAVNAVQDLDISWDQATNWALKGPAAITAVSFGGAGLVASYIYNSVTDEVESTESVKPVKPVKPYSFNQVTPFQENPEIRAIIDGTKVQSEPKLAMLIAPCWAMDWLGFECVDRPLLSLVIA